MKAKIVISMIGILFLVSCGGKVATSTATPEKIIFSTDLLQLQPGECTLLHWEVIGGFGVTLNSQPVDKTGQMEVCPTETRGYELTVDMGTRVERRMVEITVLGTNEGIGDVEPVTPGVPAYQSETWVYTGGPLGGLGYDVRMDPRNPDVMYVTDAYAGVFKSTDGGKNWSLINNGIQPYFGPSSDALPVFSLTIDSNNPDTVWTGTQYSSSIYRSNDAGASWQQMNTGDNGIMEKFLSTRGFTVEPGNSNVVYFAAEISSWEWNGQALPGLGLDMTRGVVYKTTDGGQTWKRIWSGENLARYIWIHPLDHNLLYVSTGIFDREAANSNPSTLEPGGLGVLRSHDGGVTWEELGEANGFDPNDLYIGSLFMHPQDPNILLAGAGNDPYSGKAGVSMGGVYLTENGGDTWRETLDGHNISSVEICLGDPNVTYASARTGFFRSNDGGRTWQEIAGRNWGPPDAVVGWPIDMQCDPRDAQRIFVNSYGGGVFLSEDGGLTWVTSSKGYTGALMRDCAVASDDPAHIYVGARSGIFTSSDGGENWLGLNSGIARDLEGVVAAVDPLDPRHILAIYVDSGLTPKVSFDGGQTWQDGNATFATGSGIITTAVFSPTSSSLVLAALADNNCSVGRGEICWSQPGGGVIRSMDGGLSWTGTSLSSGQVLGLAFSSDGRLVYAATSDGNFYRSDDGGQAWTLVNSNLGALVPTRSGADVVKVFVFSLAVDPSNLDKIFIGFFGGGLAISQDGGQTWVLSSAGMPPEGIITAIEVDSNDSNVVYVGTLNSGLYYSLDGGQTWTASNNGLFNRAIRDLSLSMDGSVLYATTEGAGVFRLGTP